MKNICVISSLVVLLSATLATAQNPSETAIRAGVQKYVAAFNSGDGEGAAALYTPDGTHTYAFGFTHRGRTEIARGLKELLGGPLKGARLAISTTNVRFLTPAIAVEEEAFSIEGLTSPEGKLAPPVRGLCLAVHQQLEQQWLAAAVQCLVPPPSATAK